MVSLPHILYKAPAGVHQPYMAVPGVSDLIGDLQHKRAAGGSIHLIVHIKVDACLMLELPTTAKNQKTRINETLT